METPSAPAPRRYNSNPFELIQPSWEAFKLCWTNLLLLLLTGIGLMLALGSVGVLIAMTLGAPGTVLIFALALPAVVYVLGLLGWAITKVTIEAARGNHLSFKATLPASKSAPFKYFLTALLAGLVILVGFILLIVPGVIFSAWFSLATYAVVEEGTWGVAALRRSRELTRGRTWDMLGVLLLPSFISIIMIVPILGPIAYFVMSLVLIPLYAVRYVGLVELKQQPDWQTVPTSRWNYAVLILGLLAGGMSTSQNVTETLQQQSLEKKTQAY